MTDEQLYRLRAMANDNGRKWDHSPNDIAAIKAAVEEIQRLRLRSATDEVEISSLRAQLSNGPIA